MSVVDNYDHLFKIVIVGDTNVGKTQILSRIVDGKFAHTTKPTVGVELGVKNIQIQNQFVKCQIWDTAGQQKFRAITSAYYRGTVGAIIVFDLTKKSTFQHLNRWVHQLNQFCEKQVSFILIGNKKDLNSHEIKQQQIINFTQNNKIKYLSVSAATGQKVEQAFSELIKDILKHQVTEHSVKQVSQTTQYQHTYNRKDRKSVILVNTNRKSQNFNNIASFAIQTQTSRVRLNSQFQKTTKKKSCC